MFNQRNEDNYRKKNKKMKEINIHQFWKSEKLTSYETLNLFV